MNSRIFVLILVFALASGVSAKAQLNFYFSITNTGGTDPGTIAGEIYGLQDNATSDPTNIVFTEIPLTLALYSGITTPYSFADTSTGDWGFPGTGGFTVSNGVVTSATNFQILELIPGTSNAAIFEVDGPGRPNGFFYASQSVENDSVIDISEAPEPSQISLLILGAVSLFTFRKILKYKAQGQNLRYARLDRK